MASLLSTLSHLLGKRRAAMELNWMGQVAHSPHALQLMVNRRAQGEPLQYILGTQPFGHLDLIVRAPTLIPRPETEQWTLELATRLKALLPLRHSMRMLDLCTGSGCILLLLAHLLRASSVHIDALGVDVSLAACQLARDNVVDSGTPPGCSLVIQQKNLFDDDFWEFTGRSFQEHREMDIITANPPYIPTEQWRSLPPDVRDWEDPLALLGDLPNTPAGGGLMFYKRIKELISSGPLAPHCIVAIEIGEGQATNVVEIFGGGEVWRDWWGKERAIFINGNHS